MMELPLSEKRILYNACAGKLAELEEIFIPENWELTLFARNKNNPKGHVIVTSEDDTSNITTAIKELMDQTDATYFPPESKSL